MTFVSELHTALDLGHRGDSATAVHELVANALRQLDAGAEIKRTDYFAHSFVPDLVVKWMDGQQAKERHIHLRFSVSNRSFEQDLRLLGEESPLFLGMTDTHGLADAPWLTGGAPLDGSLVAQSPVIDELENSARSEVRSRHATGALVRDGHGILDEPSAEVLATAYVDALHSIGDSDAPDGADEKVTGALTVLAEFLDEAGQLAVERALQSEWIRGGRDPHDFPSSTPWNPELLDVASLRGVLLSLLDSEAPVAPETWQRNAGFIKAEDIGRVLGRTIRGAKFNQMAHALLPNWTAKWVWAERTGSPPLFRTYEWLIDEGLLGLEVDDLRTFFADDGRHFKDKTGDNILPRLSETRQMLSQTGVTQVGLRGTMEGIRYEPLSGGSTVFNRLSTILGAPDAGSYRVQSITTVVPGTDAVADIDLSRQVIDLSGQSTPVASLARLASRMFSRVAWPDGLDHFLATGHPPEDQADVA